MLYCLSKIKILACLVACFIIVNDKKLSSFQINDATEIK